MFYLLGTWITFMWVDHNDSVRNFQPFLPGRHERFCCIHDESYSKFSDPCKYGIKIIGHMTLVEKNKAFVRI